MRGLLPAAVIWGVLTPVSAMADADAAEVLSCRPALEKYCRNIHVGCSGRGRMATPDITILFRSEGARVLFDGKPGWSARLVRQDGEVVLRPAHGDSRDWIRLERDGRFSQRIYVDGGAWMTRGTCTRQD